MKIILTSENNEKYSLETEGALTLIISPTKTETIIKENLLIEYDIVDTPIAYNDIPIDVKIVAIEVADDQGVVAESWKVDSYINKVIRQKSGKLLKQLSILMFK